MFSAWIRGVLDALPSQCMVCHAWPSQSICEPCVSRFAQPKERCRTCALALPPGVEQCGQCVRDPPPLDHCLAAVSYEYPWADLIVGYKFRQQPGRAAALALLLHSTPWVEPALDAASLVLPMPLSPARLRTRGFNQALLLARQLAPRKTEHHLLLRIKDTAPQSSLHRAERLDSLRHAFAVDPLLQGRVKGARLVLVDDVMTSGATLFSAARVLRAAGAAHITGLVIARTE
ncbi:MAG: ComF family protein [Rhodoferax sp.]